MLVILKARIRPHMIFCTVIHFKLPRLNKLTIAETDTRKSNLVKICFEIVKQVGCERYGEFDISRFDFICLEEEVWLSILPGELFLNRHLLIQ
jgi:hypothetical protein